MKRYLFSFIIITTVIFGQLFPLKRTFQTEMFDFDGVFQLVELKTDNNTPNFEIQLTLIGNLEELYGGRNYNQIDNIKIFDNMIDEELEVNQFDIVKGTEDSLMTIRIDTIRISTNYFVPKQLVDSLSFELKFYLLSRLRSIDINIPINEELKSIIYLHSNMIVIDRLLKAEEYETILSYMELYNNDYMHEFFADIIFSMVTDNAFDSIKFQSLKDIKELTDRLWGFLSNSDQYKINSAYRDSVTNIFKLNKARAYNTYFSENKLNLTSKEKFEISKTIFELCTDCQVYRQQYFAYAADYYYQLGDFATALNFYSEFSTKSQRVNERIKQCVLTLIKQYFESRRYSSVLALSKEYPSIVFDDFETSYFLAESHFYLFNYDSALKIYLDLINNWNPSNEILTLKQTRDKIQVLYTYVGDYNEAIKFNIQAFNTTNDKKYIANVILNARLKYLIPLLMFVSQIDQIKIHEVPESIIPFYFEEIINYQTGDKIDVVKSIPNEIKRESIPTTIVLSRYSTDSFINSFKPPINISFTNEIEFSSNVIIEEIQKNPNSISNWRELIANEEIRNRKMFLELLSYIIEHSCSVQSFLELLSNNSNALINLQGFKYLVYFDKNKKAIFSKKFRDNLFQRNEEEWNKSLNTNAFYVQILNYNQVLIEDITIPIYIGNNFQGVLKIGLDKYGVL